jgi:hypothetical protein
LPAPRPARRGIRLVAVALAVLAAGGCDAGGSSGTTSTTAASTTAPPTISVPTRVFVMDSGRNRLVEPDEFSYSVEGAVVGEHLHWTDWGKPAATAIGAFSEHRFSSSNRVRFRSTLMLTELRVCGGAEYYTHAELPVPSSPTRPSVKALRTPCG